MLARIFNVSSNIFCMWKQKNVSSIHLCSPDPVSEQPSYILPRTCIVGAIFWVIEEQMKHASQTVNVPSNHPQNRLFVVPTHHSSVIGLLPPLLHVIPVYPGISRLSSKDSRGRQWIGSNQATPGLLHPLPVPHHPWSQISLDFDTGLLHSEGNTTILAIVDRFSKMAHFISLPKKWQRFCSKMSRIHRLCSDIFSDRGPKFVYYFLTAFCNQFVVFTRAITPNPMDSLKDSCIKTLRRD